MPDEARKAAEQELERLPANAARRRRIRRRAQLPRLDPQPAVGKIHRGQAGFEGGGKNPERAAFRPGQSQGPAAGISSPSSSAANKSKGRSFASSARPASAKLPSAKAWPTRWAASSPASRSAACATKPKFAAIAAPTSARCPDGSFRRLRRVESRNPVILLDELDKVGADFRGDPASALLEVLDPAQNNTFTDHYLDLPFDLSRVLFIATANWLEPIHPALRDRLEVIELPSYTESEKLQIAKRYLVPRQIEEHGLTRQRCEIFRRRAAPAHPRIHARSRRAPAGTRNRRARRARPRAKSFPATARREPIKLDAEGFAELSRPRAVRFRKRGENHRDRHRHRPGVDAGGRRHSVHRGHADARARAI